DEQKAALRALDGLQDAPHHVGGAGGVDHSDDGDGEDVVPHFDDGSGELLDGLSHALELVVLLLLADELPLHLALVTLLLVDLAEDGAPAVQCAVRAADGASVALNPDAVAVPGPAEDELVLVDDLPAQGARERELLRRVMGHAVAPKDDLRLVP